MGASTSVSSVTPISALSTSSASATTRTSYVSAGAFPSSPMPPIRMPTPAGTLPVSRKNSKIVGYFADFSTSENHLNVDINLNDENATCEWHLASLSSNKDNKDIAVSIYHNHPLTFGRIDNYGVCKDNGRLVFSGTSHIVKGCHQSKSHQNAKILVFDEGCIAKAKPVLKIDENDIEASHAASVGKVSDEHIFYLTSRGLTNEEAKMLITLGYLKPILKGFDASIQGEIDQLIERRLANV